MVAEWSFLVVTPILAVLLKGCDTKEQRKDYVI